MSELFHTIKNGMWDDPAVAVAGRTYKSSCRTVQELGFRNRSGSVAPYLTWRFCYLLCGSAFQIAHLILNAPFLKGSGDSKKIYEDFLKEQLPAHVDYSRFEDFVDAMSSRRRRPTSTT